MSEIILTFQTQLSGVMETVFKAAIFEITRLVEDSFLEEVSRSREQVESLKKKLQWSESKSRRRCAECGHNKLSGEERREKSSSSSSSSAQTGVENARVLKQEKNAGESWRSCGVEKPVEISAMVETEPISSPVNTAEPVVQEEGKLDCMLKSEAVHTATATQLQDEWKLSAEVTEVSDKSAQSKSYSEQELQQIQNDWSAGLDQAPETEPDMDHIQGLLYRSRYNMEDLASYSNQELDIGGMNGLTDPPQRAGEVLGFGVLAGSLQTELGTSEECRRQLKNKRGNKSLPSDTANMDCLLINEEGYLQDVSGLSQAAGAQAGDSQGHPVYNRDTVSDSSDCFYSGEAFTQPLELNNGPAGLLGENRGDREHACSDCMITFPDQVSLKAHLNGHRHRNITTSYVCNQCGKKFPQACNLKVHQRVHQREGLHLCSHCGKGYSSFSDLRRHRCSQAGDKPYSCSLCGNKFSRLWNLKLHRRIHTQEKPHRCSMCDKSFTRADILKVHQRTHTGERPYSCRVCGLTFKRLDHLRTHQRKHGANLNNQN